MTITIHRYEGQAIHAKLARTHLLSVFMISGGPNLWMTGTILRIIDLPTGHAALIAELDGHRFLQQNHADLVVDPAVFAGQINSKSEIYDLAAEPIIQELMDRIVDASTDDSAAALPQDDTAPTVSPVARKAKVR